MLDIPNLEPDNFICEQAQKFHLKLERKEKHTPLPDPKTTAHPAARCRT